MSTQQFPSRRLAPPSAALPRRGIGEGGGQCLATGAHWGPPHPEPAATALTPQPGTGLEPRPLTAARRLGDSSAGVRVAGLSRRLRGTKSDFVRDSSSCNLCAMSYEGIPENIELCRADALRWHWVMHENAVRSGHSVTPSGWSRHCSGPNFGLPWFPDACECSS